MKNRILILVAIALLQGITFGQGDLQWVINNKEGVTRNGSSGTYTPLDFNLDFLNFNNFSYPASSNANARNDIFIIYKNGKFYNSYDLPLQNWNGLDGSGYHIDNTSIADDIKFLYWTNRYEGDDISLAKVETSSASGTTSRQIVNIDPITISYFNVNHDIVPYRDFTVIVKMNDYQCFRYTLHYNTCPTKDCSGVLIPSDLDDSSIKLIKPSSSDLTNTTLVFNSEGCSYINFRVFNTPNMEELVKANEKMRLYLTKEPIPCEIKLDEDLPAELEIPIRFSHDPNFIKLDSICEKTTTDGPVVTKDYFLHFYAQVQNTGTNTAEVKLDLPLSSDCDPNHVYIKKLYFNGSELSLSAPGVSYSRLGNLLTINFPSGLSTLVAGNEFASVAAVEYCVKIKDSEEQAGGNNYSQTAFLFPASPVSYFDGDDYPITTFIDVEKRNLTFNCDCTGGFLVSSSGCPFYHLFCNGHLNWSLIIGMGIILILGFFLLRSKKQP